MTQFTDAFAKAGLTAAGNDLSKACARFFNNGGTMGEFDRVVSQVRQKLAEVGHVVVADNGQSSNADLRQQNAEPRGHVACDAHMETAPVARQPNSEPEGQVRFDAHSSNALGARNPNPGGGGQVRRDAQVPNAPAVQDSTPGRAGQLARESHQASARPVRVPHSDPARPVTSGPQQTSALGDRKPSGGGASISMKPIVTMPPVRRPTPAQRAAARSAGHSSVPTIFERNLLPDIGPIGDIRSDQIRGLIAKGIRGSSFLLRILQYGEPPQPTKIRDYLSDKIVQKEWEASEKIDVKSVLGEGILLEPDGKLSFIKRSA